MLTDLSVTGFTIRLAVKKAPKRLYAILVETTKFFIYEIDLSSGAILSQRSMVRTHSPVHMRICISDLNQKLYIGYQLAAGTKSYLVGFDVNNWGSDLLKEEIMFEIDEGVKIYDMDIFSDAVSNEYIHIKGNEFASHSNGELLSFSTEWTSQTIAGITSLPIPVYTNTTAPTLNLEFGSPTTLTAFVVNPDISNDTLSSSLATEIPVDIA